VDDQSGMANYELPWHEYAGETTAELLALARTHRVDSLLAALEEGLQQKDGYSSEERVVVAVEALQREVNNGGFHQFFTNSSYEFAPVIVEALERIGADDAAELAREAVAALRLPAGAPAEDYQAAAEAASVNDDQQVMQILDDCDQRYNGVAGLDDKLFAFVEANAARIAIG